jgi:DNA-binding NarL/FixJ family response regulator
MSQPTADRPLNVVIVEDHPAVLMGVEAMVTARGHSVVGRTDSAEEALPMILRRRPDVAIVDITLADGSGAVLTRDVLAQDPELAVLLYTAGADARETRRALDSGARGFALKSGRSAELIAALERVAAGGSYFDPALGPVLASERSQGPLLSPREREVLALLARGLNGEEAAERLVLSPETIRTHVRNAMTKLGAHTRTHAVVLALARGEVEA